MRMIIAVFLVVNAGAAGAAPTGVYVEDISAKAQPCTDFFEFANGSWRENNPIPDSMVRWSRRWASGELAKDQLKVILDDISANRSWPQGSVEQLVGDHYAACMDEAAVNAAGIKPIAPMLAAGVSGRGCVRNLFT